MSLERSMVPYHNPKQMLSIHNPTGSCLMATNGLWKRCSSGIGHPLHQIHHRQASPRVLAQVPELEQKLGWKTLVLPVLAQALELEQRLVEKMVVHPMGSE